MLETANPIHELIRRRHSPRAFDDAPVDDGDLGSILEAARWAPSSYNEQPWSFVIGRQGEEAYTRILETLVPPNRAWAETAPVLMLVVIRLRFARNGKRNPHAEYDAGQAVAQMAIEATARGLVVHQMAGFDREQARAAFAVPADHEPLVAMTLAHPATPEPSADRQRKPMVDMLFGTDTRFVDDLDPPHVD